MAFDGCKGRGKRSASTATTLWRPEIDSADVTKSLVCCPTDVELRFANYGEKNGFLSITADHVLGRQDHSARDKVQEQTTIETMKTECSIEDRQDYDVDSAMVEELNSSAMGISENGRQPNQEAVLFKDWGSPRSMEKNLRGLENMGRGMSMVSGFGGELDGFDLRMYSMSMHQAGKLPSAQYKGVVPQPNDRCGSQIYEKHQRVWLEIFDREEDAAKAYDRAALQLRGRDAMTNLSPVRDCDPAEVNNAEASGLEGSGLKAHVCQENQGTVDAPANVSSAAAAAKDMGCLPREHLFDKVLTPSDVGKLNRLVIPKQNAEKYFPLDGNSSEKGLLLNFEDDTRKVWRFRYSYWSSSQSYVLTKGWSGFVKNKTLETGDIISFHKGFGHSDQFYIRWRRKPSGQTALGLNPHYKKSMAEAVYPIKGSSFLNPFNSCTQTPVVYNAAQWMPIIWPGSSIIPNSFTQFSSQSVSSLVNKIGHVATLRSQRSVAPLNSAIPVYFSAPPTKKTSQSRIYNNNSNGLQAMDLYLNLQMSLNSGDGRTNIKPVHPFVKPARPSTAQELETQEHKAASSLDPTAKKRVRLFGVTLAEPRNCEHSIMDS